MVIRLCALLVALFAGTAGAAPGAAPARFIPALETGDAIPPIPLVAQDRRHFTLADFAGRAVVVSFIYTRCRDARMCPLVAAKFARMQQTIGNAAIHFVLLTLDPGYDTPAVLARYGRAFNEDPRLWTLATGSQPMIDELAGRFGIATLTSAPGVIVHTEAAVVIAPDGRIAQTVYGNTWTPADVVAAARATLPGATDHFATARSWLGAAVQRCGGGAALGASAALSVFGAVLVMVGIAFWLGFREKPVRRSTKRERPG